MNAGELADGVVTVGSALVVGAVVLAVALPVAIGAAILDLVIVRRPERAVLLWDEA